MTVTMTRAGEQIEAVAAHVPNLLAQGWQITETKEENEMSNVHREIEESVMGVRIKTSWYQVGNERYASMDDIPADIIAAAAVGEVHIGRVTEHVRVKPEELEAMSKAPTVPEETIAEAVEETIARIYGASN